VRRRLTEGTRFKSSSALAATFTSRHLPVAYLVLLEGLLHVDPSVRPGCERVLHAFREGRVRSFGSGR
jgi:hypothetical protein